MSKKNDFDMGFGLGLTFIISGGFLMIDNNYLGNPIISTIASVILIILGLAGLGIEFEKVTGAKGWYNLTLGAAFVIIWSAVYIKFNFVWLNWIMLIIFLLGSTAMISGIIETVKTTNFQEKKTPKIFGLIMLIITNISTVIATIIQFKELL